MANKQIRESLAKRFSIMDPDLIPLKPVVTVSAVSDPEPNCIMGNTVNALPTVFDGPRKEPYSPFNTSNS